MSISWALQDAKNRFSHVVDEALNSGPQTVTRRGEPVVVIVAIETWLGLVSARASFKDFLRSAPLDDLDLSRDDSDRAAPDLR